METTTQINWTFIHENEGGSKTEAYLPLCTAHSIVNKANKSCYGHEKDSVIGKSGVTIASGFDLGQRNSHDLDSLKLPAHLNNALKPFLGLKKEDAKKAFDEYEEKNGHKLMITGVDAQLIDQKVKEKSVKVITKNFNAASKNSFDKIDPNAQTALASFAFQYGENMQKHKSEYVQKVWNAYTNQNYPEAIKLLEGAPEYNGRRRQEADLLRKIQSKP